MQIILSRLQIFAHHGVMPQEQTIGANFYVSVTAETDQEAASQTDKLEDTINYAEMMERIRQEMAINSKLLEHVAGRIARRLLADFPTLTRITVLVEKENPPFGIPCKSAGVQFTLNRK